MAESGIKYPFFVVNPNAAAKRAKGHFLHAWPYVQKVFPDAEYAFTTGPMDAVRLVRAALDKDHDAIIVCGGDGTNNEALNGFVSSQGHINSSKAVLGFYPSGTGGDLRRILKMPQSPFELVEYLKKARTKTIDCGKASYINQKGQKEERYFINILSFGISGLVVHIVNNSTKVFGGRISFLLGTLRAMFGYKDTDVRLILDEELIFEGKLRLTAVANGQYFGGGMRIAPEALIDDGLFDVIVMEKMPVLSFLGLSSKIYKGTHITHPLVHTHRGRQLTVTGEFPLRIDLDGEDIGTTPLTVTLVDSCIKVLVLK